MSASTPTAPSLTLLSLREFFRQTLEAILREHGLETSEDTAFYLVNLLTTFADATHLHGPDSATRHDGDRPLALLLREALEASHQAAAIKLYKRIGDQALYIAGFFSRRFDRERRVVSRGYYYDMGRRAYDTLSAMHERRNDSVSLIYAEIADKFADLVEALNALSERHTFEPARSPSDLIERWSRAQSATAGARLIQSGYLPLLRFEPTSDQPAHLPQPAEPSILELSTTRRRPKPDPLD
jgi:hypothetical protein